MLLKFQTRDTFPTGFTVFSAISGISRPQFYNPFSTVSTPPASLPWHNKLKSFYKFFSPCIARILHYSFSEHRANRINFPREHMTMDMLDILGALIALTALARLIFV
jgi:hypothetical protein